MIYGWTGDNGDPDNWLGVLYSCAAVKGSNYAKWCNPAYDKLVQQAKVSNDRRTAHQAGINRHNKSLNNKYLSRLLRTRRFSSQCARKCSDFKISPFGLTPFYGVGINK